MAHPTPTCISKGCTNDKAITKKGYSQGRLCYRCRNNLSKYGLTGPECDELLAAQGYACACCSHKIEFDKRASGISKSSAVVDHNHNSGVVRGILCAACNIMLGAAMDDQLVLRQGMRYLANVKKQLP